MATYKKLTIDEPDSTKIVGSSIHSISDVEKQDNPIAKKLKTIEHELDRY